MAEFIVAPDGRRFRPIRRGWVMRNFERIGLSRPTENGNPPRIFGLPDTTKLARSDLVSLRESLQWYWFHLLQLSAGSSMTTAEVKNAFRSLTRGDSAFTNRHGADNGYQDYVNGLNPGAQPMKYEPIITVGLVEILGDPKNIGGVPCYPIKVIREDWPPDPGIVNMQNHPEVIFRATISRREGYDVDTDVWAREDMSIPFPQLRGRDVPVPLFSRDYGEGNLYGLPADSPFTVNYIAVSRVRVLPADSALPPTYVF